MVTYEVSDLGEEFREGCLKVFNRTFKLVRKNILFEYDGMFRIFDQHLAIYTVFDKESESEVKKSKILDPGGKPLEKLT